MEVKTIFQERCSTRGNEEDGGKYFSLVIDEKDNKLSVLFSLLGLKARQIVIDGKDIIKFNFGIDGSTLADYSTILNLILV